MKILILYKSKSGSTKQYAEWLHQEIKGSELYSIDNLIIDDFKKYDLIIIGSRTYMGRIDAQKFIETNWKKLNSKKIFLFSVGMLPWESEESKKTFELIPENIRKAFAGYVKLPGRLKYDSMNFLDRAISKLLGAKEADNVSKSAIKRILDRI